MVLPNEDTVPLSVDKLSVTRYNSNLLYVGGHCEIYYCMEINTIGIQGCATRKKAVKTRLTFLIFCLQKFQFSLKLNLEPIPKT